MPLYDYECLSCGHVFELRQSFDADPNGECPRCEGASRRKFHAVPIIYKGSGFYTTDYKNSGYSGTSKENADEAAPDKSKTAKAATSSSEDHKESKETAKTTTTNSEAKPEGRK